MLYDIISIIDVAMYKDICKYHTNNVEKSFYGYPPLYDVWHRIKECRLSSNNISKKNLKLFNKFFNIINTMSVKRFKYFITKYINEKNSEVEKAVKQFENLKIYCEMDLELRKARY